ncbi:CocE/NonD family hydrolase [Actinomadura rudentiformis]|uniref:CocE/NonD family hydrolase n=1 Tax=Actinomadura rudentiformis TaxID=359158 RepID=A0A6H9YNN6_9ACTN|nr:CocE/NonD family hydrolase [Actinomadura rudentiformis]KAB2346437.1 CocE/NonD family hydrolase [Actinomadura rudentiformis]
MRRSLRWTAPPAVAALSLAGLTGTALPAQALSTQAPPAQALPSQVPPATFPSALAAGARPATYDVVVERDVRVKMSDGVRLLADVYRPARGGKAVPGRFPVIVSQTPYNKAVPGANMTSAYLVERGYVQVVMDVRGTGGSPGKWQAMNPREQRDGKEIVEWASSARRPWSNGKVGLYGASYGGLNQILTAAQRPKGLRAIFPVVPMGDAYRDVVGSGGQIDLGFMPLWLGAVAGLSVLPPTYTGSDPTGALRALQDHVGNIGEFQLTMLFSALSGGDRAFDGPFYRTRSPLTVVDKVNVPAFVVGGQFDIFQRGEPMLYQRLARRVPAKFLYGPWTHLQAAGPALGRTMPGTISQPGPQLPELMLRWYDRYLRDVADPALEALPPVRYYENGSGTWPAAAQWPPARTGYQALRLAGNAAPGRPGRLTTGAASGGPDLAPWTPLSGLCTRSTSQWTAGLAGLFGTGCETDNSENDRLGLVYDIPVRKALRLAGPVSAHLNVSTAAKDGQLTVRLEDVAPGGRATQLTAGWQVLSLRKLDKKRSVTRNGLIVQPWHPYTKASARPMPKNRPVPVDVEIFPVAGVIKPGHTLRVSIQTGDFPHLVAPVPQLIDSVGAGIKVWHDARHPSWIALPVQR